MALKKCDYDLLVKIFRIVARNYPNNSDFESLEEEVEDIIAQGGEPNVIETVKQNGIALTVSNKAVDVTVPTKTSDLTNDSDYITASAVTSEIAEQIAEIVAGAPESLDTLKEIADWIENHAADAAEMNSEIKANTEDIEELAELIGQLPAGATTVVGYIQQAIADIDLSPYLKESDFEEFTDDEIEAAFKEAQS